jgi:hypothetical protein
VHEFGAVFGVKIIRQPDIQDQKRHRDAEDSVAQRIEARF